MPPGLSDLVIDTQIRVDFHQTLHQTTHHRFTFEWVTLPGRYTRRREREDVWIKGKLLGRGSYGNVYLHQCSTGDGGGTKYQAVKTIDKAQMAAHRINYHKEVEAIAKFSQQKYHGLFVEFLGWYENDTSLFIAMEYIEHGDLSSHLKQPLPEEEARSITFQLVEGLMFLHANAFVHRDVKPKNIFVIQIGPEWRVKLGDFGISKRMSEDSSICSLVGTRPFMAPEMQGFLPPEEEEGSLAWRFTESIDMWSLGVTTYFLLFHEYPFSLEEIIKLRRYVEGSDFPFPGAITPSLSLGCRQFLEAVMGRNPRYRMSSKGALESEWLSQIYADHPEEIPFLDVETHDSSQHIPPIPDQEILSALFQCEPGSIQPLGESVVLASLAQDVAHNTSSTIDEDTPLVPPQHEIEDPSPPYEMSWDGTHYAPLSPNQDNTSVSSEYEPEDIKPAVASSTSEETPYATPISNRENGVSVAFNNGELMNTNLDMLLAPKTLEPPQNDLTIRSKILHINPPGADNCDSEEPVSHESVEEVQPEACGAGSTADSTTVEAKSPEVAFVLPSPRSGDQTPEKSLFPNGTRNAISFGTRLKYDLKSKSWTASEDIVVSPDESHTGNSNNEEQKAFSTAASPSRSLITESEAADLQSIIAGLSHLFGEEEWLNDEKPHWIKQYEKAAELLEDNFTVQRDALGMTNEATLKTAYHVAQVCSRLSRLEKASVFFKYSAKWQHETLGPYHPDTLLSLHGFGCAEIKRGNSKEAEAILRKTLNAQQAVLGPKHDNTIHTSYDFAQLLFSQEKWAEARFHFQSVITQRRGTAGEATKVMTRCLGRSGFASFELKEYDLAVGFLTEVLDTLKKSPKFSRKYNIQVASVLGESLYYLGQYPEARAILEEAVSISKYLGVTGHHDLNPLNLLAKCLFQMEDYSSAAIVCENLAEEQKIIFGPTHQETLKSLYNMGIAYEKMGEHEDADAVLTNVQRLGLEDSGSGIAVGLRASHNLGLMQYNMKNYELAQKHFELAATKRARLYGSTDEEALDSRFWNCRALIEMQKYVAAEANCCQALDYETEAYGNPLDHTLENLEQLVVAFSERSLLEKAAFLGELLVQRRKEKNGEMDSTTLKAEELLRDIRLSMKRKEEELEAEQEKVNQRARQREQLRQSELEKLKELQMELTMKEQKSRGSAWPKSLRAKIKAMMDD
ncbi:hypothetical protein N7481_009195 [Penicillium waksmanii]|uniref:uncharacterized protein n=1 Tax=Penicillium waksmanii TaxID=69791 RepID=UPI0025479976|nr:uncharacterized protein N7481_009195 [Penicillium waksmanii]KAJ5975488.1 hypothetical protein N7481_009195 [Penicillium waksmanii]